MEWTPECPVCLQNYESSRAIPRVLSCGHTFCQSCLCRLPLRFPLTIRCPSCTLLVPFPPQAPFSLPKNLQLLSLSLSENPNPDSTSLPLRPSSSDLFPPSLARLFSDEFYSAWNPWILSGEALEGLRPMVSLVELGCVSRLGCGYDGFEFGYGVRVMKGLSEMGERLRDELGLVLKARSRKINRVYGIWGDLGGDDDDGLVLFLVCEKMGESWVGDFGDELCSFIGFGVEVIEALIGFHSEGFVAGFLGPSCFCFDEFGHACVDLSVVLVMGRKVRKSFVELVSDRESIGDKEELEVVARNLWKDGVFISPEMSCELLRREGVGFESDESRYSVGFCSDTWSVACLLLRLLVGKEFDEEFPKMIDGNGSDCSMSYSTWIERISSLLDSRMGSNFGSVNDILLKCLAFDPGSRPLLSDVRRSFRELIIKPQFDMSSLKHVVDDCSNNSSTCILLGELCKPPEELAEKNKGDNLKGRKGGEQGCDQIKAERVDKSAVDSLSDGNFRFKDLHGHRDCITGITVGGGFIFSSSFDKTIRVWSLQDYTHVHTFEGHEHKVMAVVYVEQDHPLCISGDSGGGVFVWEITAPFRKEPLKKWYEQKDWRFSGIHALCFSKSGYVYTGSGDKSIKAWLLKDGTLTCTMNGHKSVVSTLGICDEVLYSGSWDGTIRLWSLSDHTPLSVLGEDSSGAVTSVLSLSVNRHMLIAAYENGFVKIWRNDVYMRSMQLHKGAIFATTMDGEWLFTGGWDKTVDVQELSGDEFHVDPRPIGTVPFDSAVTVLQFWQGKLFIGCADRLIRCITVNNGLVM